MLFRSVISENSKKSEIEEICKKYKGKEIVIVGQTTIKQEAYERVCEAIKSVNDHAEVMDTLCGITSKRQEKAFECAKNVDAKIVIVDEVHSYSTYMNVYLDRVLTWLAAYGVPVVLLSATLSEARCSSMVDAYRRGLRLAAGEHTA